MNKINLYYLAMAFLALLIVYLLYVHLEYPFGGDQDLPNPNIIKQMYLSLFVWQPLNYSGLISTVSGIPGLFFSLILFFPYKVSILIGSAINYAAFSMIGFAGMFYLVYELTKLYSQKIRYLSALLSAIIFSFPITTHLNVATIPVVVFLPWIFLFAKKLFYDAVNNFYDLNLFWLIISIAFFVNLGGTSYIVLNFIILIILAILMLTFSGIDKLPRNLKRVAVVFILSALINTSWVFTAYIFKVSTANGFFKNSINILRVYSVNLIQSMLSFGQFQPSVLTIYTLLPTLGILLVSIVSVFSFKGKGSEVKVSISIFIMFLFILGLATTVLPPFGFLFSKVIQSFSYLLSLRYVYTATHYVFTFSISALFGVGIAYSLHTLNKYKYKILIAVFLILILAIVISYLYLYDYLQIYPSVPTEIPQYAAVPKHVFQISNYINSQKGTFTVATIPIDPNWQVENWYVSVNVYSSLINKPVYTGGYSYYNEIFFPITSGEYSEVMGTIEKNNLTNTSISNMLGVFGIHYIIVQGNALNLSQCIGYCLITPFKWADIYNNINTTHNIQIVGKYGNSSLYENRNYVHLAYASNLINLGNASSGSIFSTIENSSFNIQNTSVYSTHIDNFYNDSNTINATPIANFTMPDITFIEDNPTQVTVHISNATAPYYLVFRETYDPHWAAFYSNGTEVNPRDHIAVNGFANAWYMNRTGNYTVTLYYTLQTDAWIAWGVSFAALFVTVGIGIYGWKESTKAKMRRHG